MTKEKYDEWVEKNGTAVESRYSNRIDYNLVTMNDGWIAIFERYMGEYIPIIQACDMSKALDYIAVREPVTVPMQQIC